MDLSGDPTADLFKALAHPFRLRLIQELGAGEECVCHLALVLDRPQPYVSQLLSALREAGVVQDRREGKRIYYRLRSDVFVAVVAAGRCAVGDVADEPISRRRSVDGCPCPRCCDERQRATR
jgi:DNA-binding transcriptional ArsR family regulator